MLIDNNILAISNAMFRERSNWKYVSEQQKNDFFFIYNRYFSKKFPEKSQLLNDKLINNASAMDMWFIFMSTHPYPKWFWSKSNNKIKSPITNNEIEFLLIEFDLNKDDLDILMKYYTNIVMEEIEYYRELQKQQKNKK